MSRTVKVILSCFAAVLLSAAAAGSLYLSAGDPSGRADPRVPVRDIANYPVAPSKDCRNGRAKLYDECGDQRALFRTALDHANRDGKVLLVSFGAEWCIWCHVFKQHITGGKTRFTYRYGTPDAPDDFDTITLHEREKSDVSAEAIALNTYVAASFVLVHIDSQYAPNGALVLEQTGADRHYYGAIPYIFSVTPDGKFAALMDHDRVEVRRDNLFSPYRGYDRPKLKVHLSELHDAAHGG